MTDSQELYTAFLYYVNIFTMISFAIRNCHNLGSCSWVRRPDEREHAWFTVWGCWVAAAGKSQLFRWTTCDLDLRPKKHPLKSKRLHFWTLNCQAESLAVCLVCDHSSTCTAVICFFLGHSSYIDVIINNIQWIHHVGWCNYWTRSR